MVILCCGGDRMKTFHHYFCLGLLLFAAVFSGSMVRGNAENRYLELASTIELDGEPLCIAVNEEDNRIYVGLNRSLIVIDGETDTVISTFPVDFKVEVLKVNPNTNHVFVSAAGIQETYVLDGSSGSVVYSFSDNLLYPSEIAINPVTNVIYLADRTAIFGHYDRVRVLNGDTFDEVGVINVPGSNEHPYMESVYVEVNPSTNLVYVLWTGNNTLHVVDGETYDVLTVKPVSFDRDIYVNSVTNYVYFGGVVLDGYSLDEVVSEYTGGLLAIDSTLNLVYTSFLDTLYALDGDSHEVTDSLTLDDWIDFSSHAAVNCESGKMYLIHYYEEQVSVFACKEDETSPTITITSPGDGSFKSTSNVEVNWMGTDVGLGIGYYEVKLDDDSWSHVGSVTEYAFQNLGEGSHVASVQAFDAAGNTGEASVHFVVDTTAPEIDIVSPTWDSVSTDDAVMVAWEGSDSLSGIDHYEIHIDDNPEINKGLATTHLFTDLSDGTYEVWVKAVDKAGGTGYAYSEFTINTSLFGLPGWIDEILVFAGIPLLLLTGYLFVKRKKG
jgi:DNA-binding beta-propeller fold protein YncE